MEHPISSEPTIIWLSLLCHITFAFCRAERSAQRCKVGVGQQRAVRQHAATVIRNPVMEDRTESGGLSGARGAWPSRKHAREADGTATHPPWRLHRRSLLHSLEIAELWRRPGDPADGNGAPPAVDRSPDRSRLDEPEERPTFQEARSALGRSAGPP